ncbi:MAG: nuclear transport factor 2 family protein [Sphingomonadaceae bacterium]|nr:nuclear transport factor 2 family protein [Sphingomonadaceae bacterium]
MSPSTDLGARIDRVEATLAIQQLPIRYAIAVDSRDFDAWTSLFIEDVDCGRHGKGRAVLKGFIEQACAGFYRSMHQICGHRIDFDGPDRATGQVYCRAEHESGDDWIVMAICYFDTYERRDGQWYFVRRKERHWYAADQTRRPAGPDFYDWPGHAPAPPSLPQHWPSWAAFWAGAGKARRDEVTRFPVG